MVLGMALVGCSTASDQEPIVLLVSAASSLTAVFTEIEAAFEQENPGIDVQLNLGGSSALREQILAGAPVDVFASADLVPMDQLVADGLIDGDPAVFATNSMTIAVPPDNPGAVVGLNDLAAPELFVGLCSEEVPCGRYARQVLHKAGVVASIDSNEPDVRSLVSKIELGELDAGIVYQTDVASADGELVGIDIAVEDNVTALYPIGVLEVSPRSVEARQFVDFVLSIEGSSFLKAAGFGVP